MSKNSQKRKMWYAQGKRDALSGKWKLKQRHGSFGSGFKNAAMWSYRRGFQHGLAELHQKQRKERMATLKRKAGRITRDVLVFGSIIGLVAYVAFFK